MTKIHQVLDAYAQAIYQKDLDQLMQLYTEDVVAFDVIERWEYQGKAQWKLGMGDSFQRLGNDLCRVTFSNLKAEFDEHVAGLHAIVNYQMISQGENYDKLYRITMFLRKVGDDWKISHEHVSLPVRKADGRIFYETPKEHQL